MNLTVLKDTFDVSSTFSSQIVKPRPIEEVLRDFQKVDPILKIVEANNGSPLNNVLGIIQGPYFVPDGKSQNRRFYPRELWERVIREDGPNIKDKGRLGTLEHPERAEEEHPRMASHVLKRLWIDKGLGYGKSYVLNTPVGAVVSSLFTATDEKGNSIIPIYMSSRAVGRILNKKYENLPIVDPNAYVFQTFDIVLNPGFIEAHPDFISTVETCIGEVCEASNKAPQFYVGDIVSTIHETVPSDKTNVSGPEIQPLQESLRILQEKNQALEERVRVLELGLLERDARLLAIRFDESVDRVTRLIRRLGVEETETFLEEEARRAKKLSETSFDVTVEKSDGLLSEDAMLREVFKKVTGR